MIGTIVGYLAKQLKDNQSIQAFFNDFTTETVKWIRPIFLKDDGNPKELIANLEKNPESQPRQNAIKNALEIRLEDNPDLEKILKSMYKLIQSKKEEGNQNIVSNTSNIGNNSSNNITIQGVSSGSDTRISIDRGKHNHED